MGCTRTTSIHKVFEHQESADTALLLLVLQLQKHERHPRVGPRSSAPCSPQPGYTNYRLQLVRKRIAELLKAAEELVVVAHVALIVEGRGVLQQWVEAVEKELKLGFQHGVTILGGCVQHGA